MFDCNGSHHRFRLFPTQAWYLSHERSGAIGHLSFGGKHLLRWRPISPVDPVDIDIDASVFVSYSRTDADAARYLAGKLEEFGLNVWLDEERLKVGDALNSELVEEIRQSRFFVPVLSPDYVAAKWCLQEFEYAVFHKIDVRPVKLTDAKMTFPPRFEELYNRVLGSPVFLNIRSGRLPERLDRFAMDLVDDARTSPKRLVSEDAPVSVDPVQSVPTDDDPVTAAAFTTEATAFNIDEWLFGIGMERYKTNFHDNDIDSLVLVRDLSDDNLKEMGIKSLGHRKRLLIAATSGKRRSEEQLVH